jgi:predicted Holliday junction resolvase-like endonuclease
MKIKKIIVLILLVISIAIVIIQHYKIKELKKELNYCEQAVEYYEDLEKKQLIE